MKTQWITVGIVERDGQIYHEFAQAKSIKVATQPDGAPMCAWCAHDACELNIEIVQYGIEETSKTWLTFVCRNCYRATVLSFELDYKPFITAGEKKNA